MAFYQKIVRPEVVEVITFDEFVEYGRAHGANIVDGMPWSFEYKERTVTHENDNRYLITSRFGMLRFNRGDMLITGTSGEVFPLSGEAFRANYEPVEIG